MCYSRFDRLEDDCLIDSWNVGMRIRSRHARPSSSTLRTATGPSPFSGSPKRTVSSRGGWTVRKPLT